MALKETILDRAQKFVQKGAIDKAIVEYKAAFELDPKDTSIRLRMGDLYIKVGKKDAAIKEYTEAAKAQSQRGFYLKAIAVYKQILKLDPANLDVHSKLAELYTKQRLIADAISEYSFIVTVFERNGKVQETVELLKKMIDIDPENIGVRLKLAEIHHRRSFKADALAEYAWIFDRLVSQGKQDKAEKIYLGLANVYPSEPEVLERLAGLYMASGNEAEFYKYASRLFDIHKNSGDTEKAKETCRSILEVRPNDAGSLAYLSKHEPKEPAATPPITAPSFDEERAPEPAREPAPILKEESPKCATDISASEETEKAAPEPEVIKEEPEEGIEIALEGFEEEAQDEAERKPEASVAPSVLKEEAEVRAGSPAKQGEEEEVDFELGSGAVVAEPEEEAEKTVSEPPAVTEAAEAEEEEVVLNEEVHEEAAATDEAATTIDTAKAPGILQTAGEEAVVVQAEELETVSVAEEQPAVIEHEVPAKEARPEEPLEPAAEEEVQDDISKAITELMEKIEPHGAGTEAEIIEEAPEEIAEAAEEIAEEGGEKEEYVDLSAELGLEETVENMAESWGKEESSDTFDEFKSGIGKQLNKEDSETHYNLGIAYMEMELYGEAIKEFKIALKDANLEFDCYTRLGLCYMAMSYADDAILSYLKGLRVKGKSDEERMGMMYELALAYESTGKKDLAQQLFKSIYDISPDYREVSKKLKAAVPAPSPSPTVKARPSAVKEKPLMPLDDDLIEVEIL